MLKYNIRNRRVELDPLTITLRGMKRIWEEDTSVGKESAFTILTYIHLVAQIDKDAPYYASNPKEVRDLVKYELFGDVETQFSNESELESIIAEYQGAFEEPELRAVRVINNKIDELQMIIEATQVKIVEQNTRNGTTFASNFDIINKMIQNLDKIRLAKEALLASLEKQKQSGARIRGDRQLSWIERQLQTKRLAAGGAPDDLDEDNTDEDIIETTAI